MPGRQATAAKFLELLGARKGIDIVQDTRHEKRSRYVEWEGMAERKEARDEHLLRRMAAGDEEAFGLFYGRHSGAIYRFALHMTGRKEAAEEVAQEAFMTLIQKAGKFDAERGEPAAFLYGIARNHVRRVLEREGHYEPLADEGNLVESTEGRNGSSSQENLLGELTRSETVEQVRHAVTLLPSGYREAVTLCDLQGRDYASAAKILECPIGTVRSRLARGREMLAARLRSIAALRKKAAEGSRCA